MLPVRWSLSLKNSWKASQGSFSAEQQGRDQRPYSGLVPGTAGWGSFLCGLRLVTWLPCASALLMGNQDLTEKAKTDAALEMISLK